MDLTALARFAAPRDNVVHRDELRLLGYDDSSIQRMVKMGIVHRATWCVYSVGSPSLSFRGRCRVALHAAGPGSAIVGLAALYLLRVITYEPNLIEVLSSNRSSSADPAGIKRRYTRSLPDADVTMIGGIRTARFPRALVSVAAGRTGDQLAKLIREARFRNVLDLSAVRETIERCKHVGNSAALREAVTQISRGSNGSFSNGESGLWSLVHDAVPDEEPLQNPEMYLDGEPTLPDIVWLYSLVVVEYDGAPHGYSDAQAEDRQRERRYRRRGFLVIRVTPEDLADHPEDIKRDIIDAIRRQRQMIDAGLLTPQPLSAFAARRNCATS